MAEPVLGMRRRESNSCKWPSSGLSLSEGAREELSFMSRPSGKTEAPGLPCSQLPRNPPSHLLHTHPSPEPACWAALPGLQALELPVLETKERVWRQRHYLTCQKHAPTPPHPHTHPIYRGRLPSGWLVSYQGIQQLGHTPSSPSG